MCDGTIHCLKKAEQGKRARGSVQDNKQTNKKSINSDVSLCSKYNMLQKKFQRQLRDGRTDICSGVDAYAQAKKSSQNAGYSDYINIG